MVSYSRLIDALGAIPDPRRAQGRRFPLPYLLLFCVLAVLSGAKSFTGSSLFGVGRGLSGPAPRDGRSPLSCGRGACGFVGNASALSTNPQARPRLQHQATERSRQLVPPIRLYRASASQPTHVRLPTQNSEEPKRVSRFPF